MAVQLDSNSKDDLKTQFVTREGVYRLMTLSEYSRPNRVGYQTNQNIPQVHLSLVSLPTHNGSLVLKDQTPVQLNGSDTQQPTSTQPNQSTNGDQTNLSSGSGSVSSKPTIGNSFSLSVTESDGCVASNLTNGSSGQGCERICFNFGKELYIYAYRGTKKQGGDLSKPIEKKLYKGTNPSCHDFNSVSATIDGAPLLVGFTTGQIQIVQSGRREPSKLFNEERLIDKTKVTCIKWLPKSPNLFLVSHASGNLYLYNEELGCLPTIPNYQPFKAGDGFIIYTCKSKSTRNPLYKWSFSGINGTPNDSCSSYSINEFAFSPCGSMLAIVSQDGFLRVFNYDTMELLGIARSYFGGFLCVCWSPDGKYIVVGGEDDLVTVWSLQERRIVARGQGHRSWVSVVAFDPFTSFSYTDGADFSDDENTLNECSFSYHNYNESHINDIDSDVAIGNGVKRRRHTNSMTSSCRDSNFVGDKFGTSYRLGSVSQDTQICLWDITEDLLRQSYGIRQRLSSHDPGHLSYPKGTDSVNSLNSTSQQVSNSHINGQQRNDLNNKSSTTTTLMKTQSGYSNTQKNSTESDFVTLSVSESTNNKKFSFSNSFRNQTNVGSGSCSSKNTNVINNCDENGENASEGIGRSNNMAKGDHTIPNSLNSSVSKSTKSEGLSFNAITQKLSHFGFGTAEKKANQSSSSSHISYKKSLSKGNASNHHQSGSNNVGNHSNHMSNELACGLTNINSKSSIIASYDPMKLIGTPSCPRFDECPILEPLICKKIAHERLTALIFREDCFLTACQDGFIYTWARPGYSIGQSSTTYNSGID